MTYTRPLRTMLTTSFLLIVTMLTVHGEEILNTYSYWRAHVTLRPVLFGTAEKAEPDAKGGIAIHARERKPTLPPGQPDTPLPPGAWMQPEFDDTRWWHDPGPFFGSMTGKGRNIRPHLSPWGYKQAATLALLCLRGKFTVIDPARVKALNLSSVYRGGMVIYLNGHEVKRLHVREGAIEPLTLAEDYPLDASMAADGKMHESRSGKPRELIDKRMRRAEKIALPAKHLRKGVNVLGIEIHRSAMPVEVLKCKRGQMGSTRGWFWNSVAMINLSLLADGDGVAPGSGRPKGLQVWNANPVASIYVTDYGDPAEDLQPMRIEGTRNGTFAGQVVVGSDKPLQGLSAQISSLTHSGGKGEIPAATVDILWPQPTLDTEFLTKTPHPTIKKAKKASIARFEALFSEAPPDVPVREKGACAGAVQPVWLSVRVPADAAPGDYTGTLTIKVQGAQAPTVPVHLSVQEFKLPAPKDFATWIDFVQIPEALSAHYKVPLWSDTHWKLIAQSLTLAASAGNKTLYIPLITRTNFGNMESMVRWIKNGDGYTHDFSLVEKYLDTALAAGLDPEVVCLQAWDYHVGANMEKGITKESTYNVGPSAYKLGTGKYGQLEIKTQQPVPLSLLDPASGKVTEHAGPTYHDEGAEAFWAPVAAGILKIAKKRGLEKSLLMGLAGDYVPTEQTMTLWHKLLPDAHWVTMAHGRVNKLFGITVGYATTVFGARYAVDPEVKRLYGWNRAERVAYFPRCNSKAFSPPAFERIAFEKGISGDMHGMGRQALDDFPGISRGKYGGTTSTNWGSLTLAPAWLFPGEKGPSTSIRFENGREGIQECEARIFIEKALLDEAKRAKLGEEFAARCQAVCDERTRAVILADEKGENQLIHSSHPGGPLGLDWFSGSDWETRTAKLFKTAAEVAKKLEK